MFHSFLFLADKTDNLCNACLHINDACLPSPSLKVKLKALLNPSFMYSPANPNPSGHCRCHGAYPTYCGGAAFPQDSGHQV